MLVGAARDATHLELLRKLGLRSAILVPLIARGHTIGVVTLASTRPERHYESADLEMTMELARRAALALDNALLYQEAHKAIQTRDEFLSIAAHELKTPVTSLRGYTQLALRQLRKEAETDPNRAVLLRKLEIIEEQSQKLGKLLGRLLDISRLEADKLILERQPTDIVRLVKQVTETLQTATARPSLKLEVFVSPEVNTPVTADIDPLRIEQVVINLLDNAIKFSPDEGVITVEIRTPGAKKIEVAINDQGEGIPAEQRTRLFDRFYQAHSNGHHGGMGLGLYISRQIIELHGGQLEAEFPPEGGTCFVISLPLE
jgi:signal transduction histidine kinase